MSETITMPRLYTNREIAEILGCSPEYVRKLKSTRKDELEGLWEVSESDKETYWTEEGLNVLASKMSTSQAKAFCAGQLTRRTQEAIATDRSELNYPNGSQSSTRTGQDINSYEVPSPTAKGGRYADLPEKMGHAIGNRILDADGLKRMDKAAAMTLLEAANLGDIGIDLDSLLGN